MRYPIICLFLLYPIFWGLGKEKEKGEGNMFLSGTGFEKRICIVLVIVSMILCAAFAQEDMTKSNDPQEANIPVFLSGDVRYLLTTADRRVGLVLNDLYSGESIIIDTEKAAGYYASIDPGNQYVCYKTFQRTPEKVLQRSMIYDIPGARNIPLNDWSPLAGTPAVSKDGKIAFTTGKSLIVMDQTFNPTHQFDLKNHVNLLSFSPDGGKIALNDRSEQMIVMDISSGEKTLVSGGDANYWGPQFSPSGQKLLYQSVGGGIFCQDMGSKSQPLEIGQGSSPRWIDDDSICFVSKTIKDLQVLKTDVVYSDSRGNLIDNIAIQKGDAAVAVSRAGVISLASGNLSFGIPEKGKLKSIRKIKVPEIKKNGDEIRSLVDKGTTRELEGVPVVHQVYDVSNWYWGYWACGPTSALMCLQYYATLPKATFDCTHYSAHKSNYGSYICDIYSFNGYTYDIGSYADPGGPNEILGWGGYGWIWQDNGKTTTEDMMDYINQHGPSSSIMWTGTWDALQQEIMKGYPFVILSLITSGGHYQTVIGYFKNQHTLIVNDPYGDKNIAYPSYQGQRALYDWPGYNNGYENLNYVSAYTFCRDVLPTPTPIYGTDLVVDNDDGSPDYTETGTWTTSGNPGYDGGTYRYAYGGDSATATWNCDIMYEGDYEVFAIYRQGTRASSVKYTVTDSAGSHDVFIDQTGAAGMVETSLGVFHFNQAQYSVVVDCSGSTPVSDAVISDAVRFKLVSIVEVDNDDGSPAYTETGTWSSTSNKGHNGKTYRYSSDGASAKATFTADLAHTGDYEISVVNRGWDSYVTSAEYEIDTPFGTELAYDDQTQDNLEWKTLGAYSFHEGSNTVSVDASDSTGGDWVQADAVRFTLRKIAFVVDNDDGSPAYVESGTWTTSANPGYLGDTYRWADCGASSQATWTIDLPITGVYEVFALARKGGDRCTNVKYTLSTTPGDVDVLIDQEGEFAEISQISLGAYMFDSGNNTVTIDASGATPPVTNCVISDAVRFDLIFPYFPDSIKFENSLENGGFEDDFNHWGKLGSTSYTILSSGAHGGSKCCRFYHATDYATIWQNPGEVTGETWRTTGWAYYETGVTDPGFGFKDQSGNTEAGVAIDSTSWDFYSVDWTIADNIDAQAWGTGGNVVIDDVRCGKAGRMNWINDWIWNGTYGSDLSTDYLAGDGGEANITPGPGYEHGGHTWTEISQPDGFVDLASEIGGSPSGCVTYAHIYVEADTAKSNIFLVLGSSDGIKVFLNGSQVHTNDAIRSHDYFDPDQDVVFIPGLNEGENRLMIKVKNVSGDYTFSARFCDEYGEAVSGLSYDVGDPFSSIGDWFLFR